MILRQAEVKELDFIVKQYEDIIDHTEHMAEYAQWKKGMHPTRETIKNYIQENAMYMLLDGTAVCGVMAVAMEQGEDYHGVQWTIQAKDNEVAVAHILGVMPQYQHRGVGSRLVDEAIRLAKENHKKALRLDTLCSNLAAQKMYAKKKMTFCGKQNLYAENTGWIDFYYYELATCVPSASI